MKRAARRTARQSINMRSRFSYFFIALISALTIGVMVQAKAQDDLRFEPENMAVPDKEDGANNNAGDEALVFDDSSAERIELNSDEAFDDPRFSRTRNEIYKDLAERRRLLEARQKELSVREALLQAAENELEQKYQELLSLREEIQGLLGQLDEQEGERVASLVKIYEGMKPKEAARIFNTLDLDVLLNVVSRMSERKSAPIIAAMDPPRARTLTIMLLEEKNLPDTSPLNADMLLQ